MTVWYIYNLQSVTPVGVVRFGQVDHLLVGLGEPLLVALPGGAGVPDEDHLVLGRDVLHQLGQVLAQPLGVALVGLGHLLDEGLLSLVNIDYRGLQETTNLLGIVIQFTYFLMNRYFVFL